MGAGDPCPHRAIIFSSSLFLAGLELSDTQVYEHQIRARLGTATIKLHRARTAVLLIRVEAPLSRKHGTHKTDPGLGFHGQILALALTQKSSAHCTVLPFHSETDMGSCGSPGPTASERNGCREYNASEARQSCNARSWESTHTCLETSNGFRIQRWQERESLFNVWRRTINVKHPERASDPGPFVRVSQSQFFRDVVNIWR